MARKIERCCKIKNNNLSFWVFEFVGWCFWVDGLMIFWVDGLAHSWVVVSLCVYNPLIWLVLNVVYERIVYLEIGIAKATNPSVIGALTQMGALGRLADILSCLHCCLFVFRTLVGHLANFVLSTLPATPSRIRQARCRQTNKICTGSNGWLGLK